MEMGIKNTSSMGINTFARLWPCLEKLSFSPIWAVPLSMAMLAMLAMGSVAAAVSSPSRLVAIVGGSASGKTTLCRELARLNHSTVPECAFSVLETMRDGLFADLDDPDREILAWANAHPLALNDLVLATQPAVEVDAARHARRPPCWTFLDRCVLDIVVYDRKHGRTPSERAMRAVQAAVEGARYRHVFLLETVWDEREFDARRAANLLPSPPRDLKRSQDRAASLRTFDLFHDTLESFGFEFTVLPRLTARERAELVLERLNSLDRTVL